jgi:hypothetical protein
MKPQQEGRKEGRGGLEVEEGRRSYAKDDPVRVDMSADIAECRATCIPLLLEVRVRIDSPRLPYGSMLGCRCMLSDKLK